MKAGAGARLFVALWPTAAVRTALAASSQRWTWNTGAARVDPERLHLTLHFLGEVDRERVPALHEALALPGAPFSLTLSRPVLWSGGIAVLEPARIPPELSALQAALGAALRGAGFEFEARRWRPHLTLARRAAGAVPPASCRAPTWRVRDYALVESSPPGRYTVLQRYPLRDPAALERSQRGSAAGALE